MTEPQMTARAIGISPLLERALRVSAVAHRSQHRKASTLPYITHPFAVALILQRHGWSDETVLAAALLHDVLEDTEYSLDRLQTDFPPQVALLVQALSERKTEGDGTTRSWEDRKRDHLAILREAPVEARAIALADKLHNLESMRYDQDSGAEIWPRFNAPRDRVLWYHRAMVENCDQGEEPLHSLSSAVQHALHELSEPA